MPRKNHLKERNEKLNARYIELSKQGVTHEQVIKTLSQQFFLAERTIYGIISGEYERRKEKHARRTI